MMKVMASASLVKKSTTSLVPYSRLGQAPLLFTAGQVKFFGSPGLTGGESGVANDPAAFADEKKSRVPPSTTLKQ